MAEIAEIASIARSPDHVWAALADFGGIDRWAPNVDHSCLTTERREGVGATRQVQVGRNALLERVVEWEPGERLTYRIEGLPPVVRSVTNTWRLEGAGSATTVTLTSARYGRTSRPIRSIRSGSRRGSDPSPTAANRACPA